MPEWYAELGAGLGEAEEGVSAVSTGVASGAAADLAFGDLAADIVFRAVGVERDLGAVEHHQQLGFVGVQACQQSIESDEAGAAQEDPVELAGQDGFAPLVGSL